MDNLTALYTSYLRFTFSTNSMHASPSAYRILVFVLAIFYKFMLFEFQVKDAAGTIDHAQIAKASPGADEVYTHAAKAGTERNFCLLERNHLMYCN